MNPRTKILIYDIETSYLIVKAFQLRNENAIPYQGIIQERNILTAAWKWRGDDKAHSIAVDPKDPTDDRKIVQTLIELFTEADATVAHYGDKFDHPYILTRAIFHGFQPPPPSPQIDTWKIARSKFRFNSNRLDYLGSFLGVGRKISTDRSLWDECMSGNRKAIKKMREYNEQDVHLLEAVYDKLAPYAPHRVNAALYHGKGTCPNCGSSKIQSRGTDRTLTNIYARRKCMECGKWHRGERVAA